MMVLGKGTNAGFVATAPTSDPAGGSSAVFDDVARSLKDVTPTGATKIVEMGVWINTFAGPTEEADITLGIYTHNSGDDNPEALVGSVVVAKGTSANVWVVATNLNIPINPNTIYWVAAQLDNTATRTDTDYDGDGGSKADTKGSQTTLTDPWGVSDSTAGRLYPIYAVWATTFSKQVNLNFG